MTYPPPPVSEDEEEKPGDAYSGGMEHGRRHGQGRYVWGAASAVFEGTYAAGRREGKGCMTFPDGGRFEGEQMPAGAAAAQQQAQTWHLVVQVLRTALA
jgi:hypothetical protein